MRIYMWNKKNIQRYIIEFIIIIILIITSRFQYPFSVASVYACYKITQDVELIDSACRLSVALGRNIPPATLLREIKDLGSISGN